jgi:peptidoglycan hydrolase CwlO-like protein
VKRARTRLVSAVLAIAVGAGCSRSDTAAGTDKAGADLRKAQSELADKGKEVTTNERDIEQRKRELIKQQQELTDKEQSLVANRQQLGSARGTMSDARTAYGAAVTERLAQLDAGLAGLATRTSATAKDAAAGLHARRDLLSIKLAAMPASADPSWFAYTQDVDATFAAIEHDLHAATP